ncbi:uncharacterized protein F5147DRAFT_437882 [Suillus discolor]|uniref:N-acetyltransferase domain-containing protein n=1 Tax=Suillus discolor TaxID=1912936 RepID=A0A9P7EWB9_9AGAM|nr:uncharacterized protein F5147DRAFT_437882 [Suillus discolor]KAG2091851.1 hypothetical protein F5147DRAFT_437882 [Suillus discolor]
MRRKILALTNYWSLCHPRPESSGLPLMVLVWLLLSKRRCLLTCVQSFHPNFSLNYFQTAESSWYLNCLCVDPKYQHQGIATNLIKTVEQEVMSTSILALCTDTDFNVAVYKALHFQYKGEATLPTAEDDYINMHCFTKPGARV